MGYLQELVEFRCARILVTVNVFCLFCLIDHVFSFTLQKTVLSLIKWET